MRLLPIAATLLSALAGVAATTTATASASSDAGSVPTHSVTIRPVTAAGHAARGFHVKVQRHESIECGERFASPGAVGPNVEECSPSAAYAIACWKSATAHHALCARDPSSRRVYQFKLMGSFATTPAPSAKAKAPLLIVLSDGTRCSIRDGGAAGSLKSHPKWASSYYCTKRAVVWSPPHANHYGINESKPTWTVHTGPGVGNGKLTVRGIKRAYFVGTATG